MSVRVAIPVHRVRCRIWTDELRNWSVVHEALMLSLADAPYSLEALGHHTSLPRQVVAAAVVRLMRHRLVEVVLADGAVAFQASPVGVRLTKGGRPLPQFPREVTRWLSVVVERYSGCCFLRREVQTIPARELDRLRAKDSRLRVVDITNEQTEISHRIIFPALVDIVEKGGDRRLLRVDDRTAFVREDQFMLVSVIDGVPKLPSSSRAELKVLVADTAASQSTSFDVLTVLDTEAERSGSTFAPVACEISPSDIVIGGTAHGQALRDIINGAWSRVVIHSTFLDVEKFRLLSEIIRAACARRVKFDLLWGAEAEDPTTGRNASSALAISQEVEADPTLRGSVRMRMATTGSHAKIAMADQADGSWLAAVGSCNWLASPFQMVEASIILRHPLAVADVITVLQRTVGRRPLADGLANELAITANDLRRDPPEPAGNARVTVLVGGDHEALMRRASGEAADRLLICSHRIGANVRPAAILPAALASRRGAEVSLLYTQPSKPMTRQEARAIGIEAADDGVRLVHASKTPAHGKVLLWTPDNLAATSHNWGSASTDHTFPYAEVGIHVCAPGLASVILEKFETIYPKLWDEPQSG